MRKTCSVLLLCLLAVRAFAITLVPLSFAALVDESSVIVHARVVDVQGQWTADRQGIDSIVNVEALVYMKGGRGKTMSLRLPGGRVGTIANLIPGAPVLVTGDVVVLFLKGSGPSIPSPTGLTQGIYRVTADSRTGAPMVNPPVIEGPEAARVVRGDATRRPLSLPAFEAAVRAEVR